MGQRKIIHVDMDAFYASVEQLDNPKYRGKPVIVGGSPNSRGVVATCSYEARKFGVRSAMPTRTAYNLCPNGIFVKPRIPRYKEVSEKVFAILNSISLKIQPLSLDEAYLDVTENSLKESSATKIAQYIKRRIEKEIGLTASAGVAENKFIAKIGSDFNKPDGLTVVRPGDSLEFISNLDVRLIPGVGPSCEKRLNDLEIFKIKDIRNKTKKELELYLGKFGPTLYDYSFGRDTREVQRASGCKSIGAEQTFRNDLIDDESIEMKISELSAEISKRARAKGLGGRTVTIKIKFFDFKVITRSFTFGQFVNEYDLIFSKAFHLINSERVENKKSIRLLGVSLSNFPEKGEIRQLSLGLL